MLAGRQDGAAAAEQSEATTELLFTARVQVKASVSVGEATVQITRIQGITDINEAGLEPSRLGVISSRAGLVSFW